VWQAEPCGRGKLKLSPEQNEHAREQIDKGKRLEDVAALLNVDRTTLYRALVVP
jgi:DNA invertase Pin-like site-specific DNA recombinase